MIPVIEWDGQPISKPGIYSGIDMDSYHRQLTVGPSISSSGLRTIFSESPRAYYRDSYLNPKRREQKASEAFIFGRAAHHLLLGESDFRRHFAVRPETYEDAKTGEMKPWNGNANVCKDWLAVAADDALTVLTPNDIKMIRAMADALAEDPLVQQGILSGLIETSFVWQDSETGVWLKWRPDAVPTDDLNFSDLKTTADISDEGLQRTIGAYSYHQQGALGAVACRELIGRDMTDFSLVFVEKIDVLPCVRTKTIHPGFIELGIEQNALALKLFARCLERGEWPGPGGGETDAQYIHLRDWDAKSAAFRIDELKRELA